MAGKGKKKRSAAARAKKAGAANARRDAARRERRAEEHAKFVNDRIAAGNSWRERLPSGDVVWHLDEYSSDVLREQHALFVETFGREPEPGEPIFLDPDFDTPTAITPEKDNQMFRELIRRAGVDEAYADAYEELGYVITEANMHTFSLAEIDAFGDAVDRHRARRAGEN